MSIPNCMALLWDIVREVFVVQSDEQFVELTLFASHISYDLEEELWVITERVWYWVDILLSLEISADSSTVLPDQVVELECKSEDLIKRNLESVVRSVEERLHKNFVKILVVQAHKLLKIVELR